MTASDGIKANSRNRQSHHTICRACHAGCGVIVDVENGVPVNTRGDAENPLYKGFCCIKGQHFHDTRNSPQRLLHSQKRQPDGSYAAIPIEQAMDEIAGKIQSNISTYGPRSLATYSGTMAANTSAANGAMSSAWLKATGSRMGFNSSTIDQPGKMVAAALHGRWMAPSHNFAQAKVLMLLGANPLVAMSGGVPHTNPGRTLTDALAKGLKLIVIDPRRSETARRANIFLQIKPGHDVPLLAAMLHTIIAESLYDAPFIAENACGLEHLTETVAAFTPERVAEPAGLTAQEIRTAARTFAISGAGVATAGTGPNMAGHTTLLEYLILNLNTLCGRWQREGDKVFEPATLGQPTYAKAQALPPYPEYAYGFGEKIRVRNLRNTASGLPTAALADEILLEGEGRVRCLISHGGNPVSAWPDQLKTEAAMNALDMLVQIDVTMSTTAKLADYVIAVKHPLECAGTTLAQEYLSGYAVGFGATDAYAQYTPPIVDAPENSDLIEDWEFFYGLAQRMGLALTLKPISFNGVVRVKGHELDMQNKPDSETLLDMITFGSRIPLDTVRKKAGGGLYPDPPVYVQPKDADWQGRLELANPQMMQDLQRFQLSAISEFSLVCRRQMNVLNSTGQHIDGQNRGKHFNPAFMHPDDLAALNLKSGDKVEIRSARASIYGLVEPDKNLRRGLVSMSHCWGSVQSDDALFAEIGSNTGRLTDVETDFEPYTGMPRMSNIPVQVSRAIVDFC
jgi:anaerobic selenocysteine-containing dehydrogenase